MGRVLCDPELGFKAQLPGARQALKLSKQLAASQTKATKALEASAKPKASAKAAAKKALEDNSMLFRHTDLSKEAVSQIRHLYLFGLKRRSRCRWQTGCLSLATTSTSSPIS